MKKNKSIKIRVTQDEHSALHAIAKTHNLSVSAMVRSIASANPIQSNFNKKGESL
jgi:hypothetical protein